MSLTAKYSPSACWLEDTAVMACEVPVTVCEGCLGLASTDSLKDAVAVTAEVDLLICTECCLVLLMALGSVCVCVSSVVVECFATHVGGGAGTVGVEDVSW